MGWEEKAVLGAEKGILFSVFWQWKNKLGKGKSTVRSVRLAVQFVFRKYNLQLFRF